MTPLQCDLNSLKDTTIEIGTMSLSTNINSITLLFRIRKKKSNYSHVSLSNLKNKNYNNGNSLLNFYKICQSSIKYRNPRKEVSKREI